ncbi:MAG: LuxR C-terminal-related transcriptional regulator [Acidobacteria bacterium]|nr:LuxR C-terminal-related transcriptional regulator [Acidobacteriota bacterium]
MLTLVADGLSNKEIAGKLHISVRTAENHRHSISKKLGIQRTAHLVKFAIRHCLTALE